MKQIFDGYDEKQHTGGMKQTTGDLITHEYADFTLGAGKSSSPEFEKKQPFGLSYNEFGGTRNTNSKLLNTPAYPDQNARREEIDMDELNALLGLNDDNFESKFAEIISNPSKPDIPKINPAP